MKRVLLPFAVYSLAATTARADCPADARAVPPPVHDQLTLTRVTFKDLPGWTDDNHADAVPAFLASCARLAKLADNAPVGHDGHGGIAKQWRSACAKAKQVPAGDHAAARTFFERAFVPHQAAGHSGPVGKLTGYHVQQLNASRTKHGKYQVPILSRPDDLVMVDLSELIPDAHGRRVWGRHDATGKLVPYFTRAEIRKGALAAQKLELMYAVGKPGSAPWRSLLVAQDTGGGILGAVRGDVYWGDDATAEELGGRMGGQGRYWLLLPNGVTK